jgi:chromate transporter
VATAPPQALREVALLFLRLGTTAFGGPAAHIAMMRHEVVTRLGWMDDQEFLDHAAATNLVPGPNSTELAIVVGHRRAGARGLVTAGVCFIVPAFLIVLGLAVAYERYGTTPTADHIRYGVLPVILAIIATALWALGRTAVKGWLTAAIGVGSFAAYVADVHELVILAAAATLAALPHWLGAAGRSLHATLLLPLAAVTRHALAQAQAAAATGDATLWGLWWVFLKVGSLLYGSGYVLVAFLESDLVNRLGWLTEQQLLDAVAVGQLTPGPVFTTATFVGYVLAGVPGAVVSTVAIFAPAFVFVALLAPVVRWMQRTPWARRALNGLNAAAVGLLAGVMVALARTAFPDVLTVVVGLVALGVLLRWKVNSAWLVLAGAAVGLLHGL